MRRGRDVSASREVASHRKANGLTPAQALADDALIYSHTEHFVRLCEAGWRSEATDHAKHTKTDAHIVTGRIFAPPRTSNPTNCRANSMPHRRARAVSDPCAGAVQGGGVDRARGGEAAAVRDGCFY